MDGIVDIQLDILNKRLAGRKIVLNIDETAKTWLADQGYDPVYGARPLKRVIQKALQDELAEVLLSGELLDGAEVAVSANDAGLTINGKGREPRVPKGANVH
jgi:ATP-dependent Clp protease ATP-binding subunit ClpB